MMIITERRIVKQDWFETEFSKTGWDSYGWFFDDGSYVDGDWQVVNYIHVDKYGNPFVGVAERKVNI